MATPSLAEITKSRLPGARSPAAKPKPVPKRKKKPEPTFLSAATELRSYQDKVAAAKKTFMSAPPPLNARVIPDPGPMPDYSHSIGLGKRAYLEQQAAHKRSLEANAAWRKQREQQWRDFLSGKTEKEQHDAFVAKADKAVPMIPGGRFTPGFGSDAYQEAHKAAVAKARKQLEADWQRMQKDPEGYAEEQARKPKDVIGQISAAGIGLGETLGLPKSISNDLRLITAGFLPGVVESSKAGYGIFTGNPDAAEAMLTETVKQYRQNYVDHGWKGALSYASQHPVLFTLDASILIAPAAKVGSIGALTRAFMEANEGMNVLTAARLAAKESGMPGYAAAQGFKGGIPPRTLKGRTYSTDLPRPVSRSPIGRAGQRAYDAFSRTLDVPTAVKIPGLKALGTSARAGAADAKELRRRQARTQALLDFLRDPVSRYATDKGAQAKLKKLVGDVVPDPARGAALVAALEAGTDVTTALTERIAALNNVLEHGIMWDRNIDSPHRDEYISTLEGRFTPDEVSALTKLTDSIALASNPRDPAGWYKTHLAEASSMNASDFIRSGAGAAAQFQIREGRRDGLLEQVGVDQWGRSTRTITRPEVDTEVARLINEHPQGLETAVYFRTKEGKEGVLTTTAAGNFEKHTFDDGNTVTMTAPETSAFLKGETQGPIWVGDQGAVAAFETPVFYSPLQRAIAKLPGTGMKANSLKKALQKQGVSKEEWKAMGLDAFFRDQTSYIDLDSGKVKTDEYARVEYDDLQRFLGDALNAYNLDEYIRSSHTPLHYHGTFYGEEYGGGVLLARTPTGDQPYYELTMTLGGAHPLESQHGAEPYRGRGYEHWEQENVVVHIRFHVIEDLEGKRAILIDEIQSDWASDYRKAGNPEFNALSEEQKARLDQIAEQLAEATAKEKAVFDMDTHQQALEDLRKSEGDYFDWPGGDPAELAALEARVKIARINYTLVDRAAKETLAERRLYSMEISELTRERHYIVRSSKKQPPPLGGKELDAAARRMSRWAAEADVDRIIIVPGEMQSYRNAAFGKLPDGKEIDLMSWHENAHEDETNWRAAFGHMSTEELRQYGRSAVARESGHAPTYFRLYEEQIPSMFERALGVQGRRREHAFAGYYADQLRGLAEYGEDVMGGYVIDLTPEAKAKAMQPMALFQHAPNWNNLPRGATQFLADGRTAMRLFEGAGVDTVIHELAHIALPDLSPADRAIVAEHFGGEVADWTNQQHEAFARGFEGYLYSGKAPTPELQNAFEKIRTWIAAIWNAMKQSPDHYLTPEMDGVFARMVLPKDRSPLNEEQRNFVHAQIKELEDALANPGDPAEFDAALVAMRHMSEMAEEQGREVMLFGFDETPDPDTGLSERDLMEDEIDEMLDRRRNAYSDLLRSMGIISPDDTTTRAAGYFPNLSIWRIGGDVPIAPTKLAATSNVMGVAQPRPDAINMHRNQFIRFQTGDLGMNPAVMYDVLRMRIKHLTTLKLRQRLYEMGDPIKKGQSISDIDEGLMFIRDQKQDAAKVKLQTRAALGMDREAYMALVERGEDPAGLLDDDVLAANAGDPAATQVKATDGVWWKGKPGEEKPPPWMRDESTVRTVPRHVAEQLFGEVFPSAPRGGELGPTLNALARMSLLYAPGPVPGSRYVVRNFLQNAVLTGMTHPTALRKAVYATRRLEKDHPDLARRIDAEAGSTRAEAALPEYYVKAQTRKQRNSRRVTELQKNIGGALSAAADNPFRRSAWIGYAERYGFHGPEGWRRLLTDTNPAVERTRQLISQAVRDDLIDFDAMSEKERRFASHYFFLYPFIRGSLKWPFMYAREYPFRAGVIGSVAATMGQQRERTALAKTTSEVGRTELKPGKKQYEFGWLDPFGPAAQTLESLAALAKGLPKNDFTAMLQMLSPEYRALVTSLSGSSSKTRPFGQLLDTFVPFAAGVRKAKQGGSLSDQLLRHFSLSVEPGPSRQIQRKQASADLVDAWQWAQAKGLSFDLDKVQKSARAYERYQDLDQRISFSQKDIGEGSLRADDLTEKQKLEREQQKALALSVAVGEGFPETEKQMAESMKKIRGATLEELQAYNKGLQENAFSYRNDLINAWKKEKDG